MNDREKKLALAVGVLVALWVGNWGWQKYSDMYRVASAKQSNAAADLQTALFDLQKTRAAVKDLRQWREKSLPSNVAVAQSQYRAWLVERLQNAGLSVADVTPRRSNQQSTAYQALAYEVEATGKLDGVVRFMDSFYRSDQLHKIANLRLTPLAEGNQLRLGVTVEALVVNGTKREEGLATGTSDRLELASADDYVERIVKRNPFVPYEPPPPPRPKVVERPQPKPVPKPEFNHAEHAKLTGVVSVGDDYQAWVTVQTLGERLYLRKGDQVKVGQFEGTVVDVYEKELVIETDTGVLAFRVGDKLTDGKELTSTAAGT